MGQSRAVPEGSQRTSPCVPTGLRQGLPSHAGQEMYNAGQCHSYSLELESFNFSEVKIQSASYMYNIHCYHFQSLRLVSQYWQRGPTLGINVGGLAAAAYVLHRTGRAFRVPTPREKPAEKPTEKPEEDTDKDNV